MMQLYRRKSLTFLERHSPVRFLSSRVALDKVLVANRGEIACRIIRTCKRLEIPTVAVYSSADGPNAMHAAMADESFCVGTGPSAADSYLRGDEILEIAQRCGVHAIHPGYGFLSENADFCRNVQQNDLIFVGPNPDTIEAMGSKSHSKDAMEQVSVPTTPGYHGSNQDPEFLLHQAVTTVGFPLLIKAVMGGGGKGMRLVWKEEDFLEALESCQRESMSAFGDSNVLLEKYLVHPRHVEVQIMADTHGNTVHLHERDCSLQRRHQKVLEEAPASDLPPALRAELGEAGVRAAQAVQYTNAGTVEFLLDTQSDSNDFYFCEMNTRLQVEHPVTELITGQDLVEWQLRVAAGEELPLRRQEEIPCQGHAIEARVYAENTLKDFLPATGKVLHHQPTPDARVDTGIQPGSVIGVHYDPMISKLIVHGPDRPTALRKLVNALQQYQIVGVPNNLGFLTRCAQHPVFQEAGATNTGFLDDYMNEVQTPWEVSPEDCAVAAFVAMLHREQRVGKNVDSIQTSPWSGSSWRMGGLEGRPKLKLRNSSNADCSVVECISNRDGSFDIGVGPDESSLDFFSVEGSLDSSNQLSVVIDGTRRLSMQSVLWRDSQRGIMEVHVWPETANAHPFVVELSLHSSDAESSKQSGGQFTNMVKAPMPGKIVRINVFEGDAVREGDVLMVMEAMKMEHTIRAPQSGTVMNLACQLDQVVDDGAVLATVEDNNDDATEEEEEGTARA